MSNIDSNKNSVQKTILENFGINSSASWDIVATDDSHNLVMVHHKPEANLDEYGKLRGVVVDTKANVVVCKSFEHTPVVNADVLTTKNGIISLTDKLGVTYNMDPANITVHPGFEGTIMTVFKHDDKVFRTTRRKLDPSRSRWGNSKSFTDMYWELDGPMDEDLFDPDSAYSPYCHVFIIVHPDVLVVSKTNIGNGYLVYLGPKQMWSVEYNECPYKQIQEKGEFYNDITKEEFDADQRPNAGWIDQTLYIPELNDKMKSLPSFSTIEQTNHHLRFGFHGQLEGTDNMDQRILPGEFIIINQYDENRNIVKMLRVESSSYAWRSKMRDNNPNIAYRFHQLINRSTLEYKNDATKNRYNREFPFFTPYDQKVIQDYNQFFLLWPQQFEFPSEKQKILSNKDNRVYNIWLAYLNSMPLHKQKEVASYLDNMTNNRNEVIGWLRQLENVRVLDRSLYSKRVLDIISSARSFARNPTRNDRFLSNKQKVRKVIRNFLMKEDGHSLYGLIREMNKHKTKINN